MAFGVNNSSYRTLSISSLRARPKNCNDEVIDRLSLVKTVR